MLRSLLPVALLALATALAGCSPNVSVQAPMESHSTHHGAMGADGFADDRTRVQVLSTLIGGKNVFLPATIVLTEGAGRSLSFFNTTDKPHGMTIPGLNVAVVLPPGEEYVVELPALEGAKVHQVVCHLHGAHRTATLVVLPAAE